ncbi:MAG: hypothetical protein JWN30_278 [Bacilli bacterium]|nr:hypothetical protein [Bacilli bacterium]
MRWWIFTSCTVLVLVLLVLTGTHLIWAQELPDQSAVNSYVLQNAPVRQIDSIDRFTGRVPCYVLHGLNNGEQPVTVLATANRILGILPDAQTLSKSSVQTKIDHIVPGFHPDRMSLGIYVPGDQPVDPNTIPLKLSDSSWHYVWEVFGSGKSGAASVASNYLIDLDYSTGELVRKIQFAGERSF